MVGTLLVRGMLVGIVAGIIAAVFAYLVGEPSIELAIAFEQKLSSAAGEAEAPELVSRAVQSTVGLLAGLAVFGAAVGGLFALAYAFAQGRLGRLSPRTTSTLLAGCGFVVLVLIPQLKYPANPPAVGVAETIGSRTGFYFALLLLSVAISLAALSLARLFVAPLGRRGAALIGIAGYLLAMAVVTQALPSIDEVPNGFSETLLWQFRLATLGIHAVLWAIIGIGFGVLTERSLARTARPTFHAP